MRRRNVLIPTDVEIQMQRDEDIKKGIDKVMAAYIKYRVKVKAAEEEVFKALFKQAEYQRGDVVFISCELQSEIGFDCEQIKYSAFLKEDEYLVLNHTMTPRVIGGEV